MQNVVQTAVDLLKFSLILCCHFVAPAKSQRKTDPEKFQQIPVTFGFTDQALQQDENFLSTPASLWKWTSNDCLIHSFLFDQPLPSAASSINVQRM